MWKRHAVPVWIRLPLGALALVAAVTAAVAVDRHLFLGSVRGGFSQGLRLPDLVLLAATAAVGWLCVFAAVRSLRPGFDAVLLTGPAVLGALAAEWATVPSYDDEGTYSYIALAPFSRAPVLLDAALGTAAVLVGLAIPTLIWLRSRRGTPPPDLAPPL
jgi:hypothetical protein